MKKVNYFNSEWKDLEQAYGSAEDIPRLLEMLSSPHEEIWREADHELSGTIYHQGTVYTSTVKAIPELLEVLAFSEEPKRMCIGMLLCLIASCSCADDIALKPGQCLTLANIPDWRRLIETSIDEDDDLGAAIHKMGFRYITLFQDELDNDDDLVRQCVIDGMGAYLESHTSFRELLTKRRAIEAEQDVIQVLDDVLSAD